MGSEQPKETWFGGRPGRAAMVRLTKGADLWEELQRLAGVFRFEAGSVQFLGAVERAVVSYYHQDTQRYERIELNKPLEITGGLGNISLKDGKPFVHAHISLADAAGQLFGGHLEPGTVVFATEVVFQELQVPQVPRRSFDEATGLFLWQGDRNPMA